MDSIAYDKERAQLELNLGKTPVCLQYPYSPSGEGNSCCSYSLDCELGQQHFCFSTEQSWPRNPWETVNKEPTLAILLSNFFLKKKEKKNSFK